MSDFLVFRRFENLQEANAVRAILNKKNIPSVLSEERALLDSTLIGQNFDQPYLVKILSEHFTEADKLLRESTDISTIEVEKDYYLLTFSDDELLEIIEKKDEWGTYDYALALQLLKERGLPLTSDDIDLLNRKRIKSLATPEDGMNIWMIAGYLSALLGGALGLFIGIYIMIAKKTLPDGVRIFAYNDNSRKHGKYITILALLAIPLWITYTVVFNGSIIGIYSIFGLFTVNRL